MSRKSKRVVLVATAMLFSVLACSTGGTTPQGEERQQSGVSPVPEAPTQRPQPTRDVNQGEEVGPSQPQGEDLSADWNLEVWAIPEFHPWGGQGMQRIVYYLGGKNASTNWYGYQVGNDGASQSCTWMWRHNLRPTLFTEEGYEYSALDAGNFQQDYAKFQSGELPTGLAGWYNMFSFTPTCGVMYAGSYFNPLPPGAGFTIVSENMEYPKAFGIAMFDIPEDATPEALQVPYSCLGQWHILECEARIAAVRLDADVRPVPIDESYGARIHDAGEKIEIGDVATLAITADGTNGSSILLTFVLESRHSGYSLKIDWFNFSFLHREPLVLSTTYSDGLAWGNFPGEEVGPMQTLVLESELALEGKYWPTPIGETFWLFGHIELKEDSPTGVVTAANYLVELP